MRGALVRLSHFLAPVKFGGAAPSRGQNMVFRKIWFGWVNIRNVIFGVSRPQFTNFFYSTRNYLCLIMPFTASQYFYLFQRYLRSNSKVVIKRTKFCTFSALPNFKGAPLLKSCTRVITPIQQHVTWQSLIKLIFLAPKFSRLLRYI